MSGTIDVSGQAGLQPATSGQRTGPTIPGAGGYGGGAAAFGGNPALPGLGPLGGIVNFGGLCAASTGGPGGQSATPFLVPLLGGSGGGGAAANGGAGGGALLIASSMSITVNGTITAAGGIGSYVGGGSNTSSGGGAGGGIRLVAPLLAGGGTITAAGGVSPYCGSSGADGIVRLESYQHTFSGPTGGKVYTASPVNLFLPVADSQPYITVKSIGGISVPPSPTGSFVVPDVLINSTSPLTVNIQATNVPPGTIPTLYFSTQNFPDQKIFPPALAGTLGLSTTSTTVTLSPGYSIGFVTATWVQ